MSKTIRTSGSSYFEAVECGARSIATHGSHAQGVGNMRYNINTNTTEVFNGITYVPIDLGYTTLGLSREAIELLDWARERRAQELQIKALADQHPGIQDLQEKLKIMIALVSNHSTK